MTANDDSAPERPEDPAPPSKKEPPGSPGKPPRAWPYLLITVLLLAAFLGLIVFAASRQLARYQQGGRGSGSATEKLLSARVEGRAARYHLTFADFTSWHLNAKAPEGADRWLTHDNREVHAIVEMTAFEWPDLDRTVDFMLEQRKRTTSSFSLIERTRLTDRSDPGVLVHVRSSQEGLPVEELVGFFADEGAIYLVKMGSDAATFSRMERELEAVVRSFELPAPPPAPTALPRPPLDLAAPPAPPDDAAARKESFDFLESAAREAGGKGDYARAVQLQHWAIAGGSRQGKYNLACYYGLNGQIDASLYWIQRSIEEGIDPKWAAQDSDLEKVRADPRWSKIGPFLREAARYWASSGVKETRIVLPKGYTRGQPIPVVLGLHGRGSNAADFSHPSFQAAADALSVAFVSASGTIPNGPASFHWAESVERDDARLDVALEEVSDRVTIAPGKIVLIGFSQGAQMAAEIAARRPEKYAGAIVMSPGTDTHLALYDLVATPALAQRRFVIVVGAGEHPGNVERAASDARALRGAQADVFHKAYAGVTAHSVPLDFESALPKWVRYILGSGPKPAADGVK